MSIPDISDLICYTYDSSESGGATTASSPSLIPTAGKSGTLVPNKSNVIGPSKDKDLDHSMHSKLSSVLTGGGR
jgi:hypothetical protein